MSKAFEGLKYFHPDEEVVVSGRMKKSFPYPELMETRFMRRLDMTREQAGVAFIVTDSYRPGDAGFHGQGRAVDIRCHWRSHAFKIVEAAIRMGFRGIGVYDSHVHLDDREVPTMWVGTSSEEEE